MLHWTVANRCECQGDDSSLTISGELLNVVNVQKEIMEAFGTGCCPCKSDLDRHFRGNCVLVN